MTAHQQLKPANELAKQTGVRFPNESVDYRQARDKLPTEEIELRRHIRVAEQRRAAVIHADVNRRDRCLGVRPRQPRVHGARHRPWHVRQSSDCERAARSLDSLDPTYKPCSF